MHDTKRSRGGYSPPGANKKVPGAGKGKGKGQGKSHVGAPAQSSNAPTSHARTRPHKPMLPSVRPCLKWGSRDHDSGKCPRNQEHRSYMAHAMNFTAWCVGSDESNSNSIAAEAFGCENLARGRVLLGCEATDTGGSVKTFEAIIDKSQEAFGADHDWVSVDTNDRPGCKFGDAKRKQALPKVRMKVQPGGHVAFFLCMPRERKECLYCCRPSHSLHWEQ